MITKRGFVLRGSCFCEKYIIAYMLADVQITVAARWEPEFGDIFVLCNIS